MTLSNDSFRQSLLILSQYQKQLNLLLVVLLSLYLLSFAAKLTWQLMPQPESAASNSAQVVANSAQSSQANQKLDLSTLKRLNLFGQLGAQSVAKPAEETITDAPETKLNLTLAGVVSDQNPEKGTAIIGNRGKQSTYAVGEKIDGTNALLKEVYTDRVIIRNGARNETLMLDGVDYAKNLKPRPQTASNTPAPKPQNNRPVRKTLSRDAAQASRELKASPANFTDFISISPYTQAGELQGYRIAPGRKPELFKAAGFKAGDVVVDINGLDLRDPQQALEAMTVLRESPSLQLTVNRNDELLTLYLDIPEED